MGREGPDWEHHIQLRHDRTQQWGLENTIFKPSGSTERRVKAKTL